MHWPIVVFRDGASEAVESITKDLSSKGFYCLSESLFEAGELIFCKLRVPVGKDWTRVMECKARVLRTEPAEADGVFGIACAIEDYRFLAESV